MGDGFSVPFIVSCGEMNELIGIVGRLQKLKVPDFMFKREPP